MNTKILFTKTVFNFFYLCIRFFSELNTSTRLKTLYHQFVEISSIQALQSDNASVKSVEKYLFTFKKIL